MTSEKIHFSRTSCGDFVLASKMKPKFDCWTPPYFCDIGIFDKVAVTLTVFKHKYKSEKEILHPFSGPLDGLFMMIFLKIWKKTFSVHFYTYLKIIDLTLFFVFSNPHTKISIALLFLVLHDFHHLILKLSNRASQQILYSKRKMVVRSHQIWQMRNHVKQHGLFLGVFVDFLIFGAFHLIFGPSIILINYWLQYHPY